MLFQSSTVLLTYQGDCFVMDLSPSVVESLSDVAMLVEFAQKLPAAQELCTAFKLHSEQLSELLGATAHCFGVEICLDTWSSEGILRLHGHLFLKHSDKKLRAHNKKPNDVSDSVERKNQTQKKRPSQNILSLFARKSNTNQNAFYVEIC